VNGDLQLCLSYMLSTNMNTKNFKDTLGKLSFKREGRFLGIGTSPEADWKIIFFAALIAVVAVAIFSTKMFYVIESGEYATSEDKISGYTLNTDRLKKIVAHYNDRESRFNQIINIRNAPSDPSI
jgi:hypothetical protein